MTNKPMLVINHIEPVGLIAESGSELAKAFSNTYFNQAAILIKMNRGTVNKIRKRAEG